MFNRGGFNQTEFNTTSNTEVYLYGTLTGEAGISAEFNAVFMLSSTLPGEGSLSADIHRLIEAAVSWSAEGEIAAKVLRVFFYASDLQAESWIIATPTQLRKEMIEFMGDIKPGDELVIDMEKMTATLNGQNVLHLIDLDRFNLRSGTNELTYEDEEGTRTIHVKVTHRDRWL